MALLLLDLTCVVVCPKFELVAGLVGRSRFALIDKQASVELVLDCEVLLVQNASLCVLQVSRFLSVLVLESEEFGAAWQLNGVIELAVPLATCVPILAEGDKDGRGLNSVNVR